MTFYILAEIVHYSGVYLHLACIWLSFQTVEDLTYRMWLLSVPLLSLPGCNPANPMRTDCMRWKVAFFSESWSSHRERNCSRVSHAPHRFNLKDLGPEPRAFEFSIWVSREAEVGLCPTACVQSLICPCISYTFIDCLLCARYCAGHFHTCHTICLSIVTLLFPDDRYGKRKPRALLSLLKSLPNQDWDSDILGQHSILKKKKKFLYFYKLV